MSDELFNKLASDSSRLLVATVLVREHSIWAPRRDFERSSLWGRGLDGKPLSCSKIKTALNWLVWNKLAFRIVYDNVAVEDDEVKLVRTHTLQRRGLYSAQSEYWEYCPTAALHSLLGKQPVKELAPV